MEKQSVEIEFDNVEMTVNGYYYRGYAGDWNTPPEPRDFDIQSVYIEEQDVTALLDSSYNYVKPNYKNWELRTKLDDISDIILIEYL